MGVLLAVLAPPPSAAQSTAQAIEWLDPPRGLSRFQLLTRDAVFDNDALQGQWTIVQFGFLNCVDVCPTSLAQTAALLRQLPARSLGTPVSAVFISVDPGRDTVKEVSAYAGHFHPAILGVTGERQQLQRFARDLGVNFDVDTRDSEDSIAHAVSEGGRAGTAYNVSHSTTFSIINPQGELSGRFRPGFDLAGVAAALQGQLRRAGG